MSSRRFLASWRFDWRRRSLVSAVVISVVALELCAGSVALEAEEQIFGFNGPLLSRRFGSVSWPSPWSFQKTGLGGDVQINVETAPDDPRTRVLRLRTNRASFVLYQDLRNNPVPSERYPKLSWQWKAIKLPRGGNANYDATNDQALQVYLAFRRSDGYDVLGYVWDNPARPGDKDVIHRSYSSILFGRVELHTLVLRRGLPDDWVREERNVVEDHQQFFKASRPRVVAIGIWCDSDHTGSVSEGLIGPLKFSAGQLQDPKS